MGSCIPILYQELRVTEITDYLLPTLEEFYNL